jgi:hypothetical protein
MHATVFECHSPAGELLARGPIQGNGGKLGYACSHLPAKQRDKVSLDTLLASQHILARKGHQGRLYEPKPGCIAVYPQYCAAGDGPSVAVPLVGTTFVVVEYVESKSAPACAVVPVCDLRTLPEHCQVGVFYYLTLTYAGPALQAKLSIGGGTDIEVGGPK